MSDPFELQNNTLSQKQIVRRFKCVTGETPLSYLHKLRIEAVKMKLEAGAKSINKIIRDGGYEDVSSFRRLFKKISGLILQDYHNRFASGVYASNNEG